jgi:hypothetical protein
MNGGETLKKQESPEFIRGECQFIEFQLELKNNQPTCLSTISRFSVIYTGSVIILIFRALALALGLGLTPKFSRALL